MQHPEESSSKDPSDLPSPLAKKQRLAAAEDQPAQRSRFFRGEPLGAEGLASKIRDLASRGGGSRFSAPPPRNNPGLPQRPEVALPTEEDLETGLWSPERAASPQLPSQGIAKRLQLSQTPVSHRSEGSPAKDSSLRPVQDDAGTLPLNPPQPKLPKDPSPCANSLYGMSSCAPGEPHPRMAKNPHRAIGGIVGERGGLHGREACSQHMEGGGRSRGSGCHSAGGSSGGAKNAAKHEECEIVDEYASVFDFL